MTWLLMTTLLLLPSYLFRFSVLGIPTTMLEILIYISIVATLITQPWAIIGERLKPVLKRFGWPIAFFILSGLIATFISPDKRVALGLLKGYILDPILLCAVLIINTDTQEKSRQLITALFASLVVVSLSVIFGPRNVEGRSVGLYAFDAFASPNFVALYVAPLATLAFASIFEAKPILSRAKLSLFFLLGLGAVIAAGSRGGILGIVFGVGLTLVWYALKKWAPKKSSWLPWVTALFIIIAIGFGALLSRPNFGANASRRASTSNNLRYEIWRTTIVDILPKKALFGVGLGNYQPYFTDITANRVNFPEFISPWARSPHNIFLTIWVNLGLIGIISFVAILWFYFRTFTWSALYIGMTTLLAHGLVDAAYWKNDLAALFWVLVAFAVILSQPQPKKSQEKNVSA